MRTRLRHGFGVVLFSLTLSAAARAEGSKLDSGLAALASSDYAAAERDLKAAAAAGDRRGAALLALARVELVTGRYLEAAKTAETAIRAHADVGGRADATAVRADALSRLGKVSDAIALLEPLAREPSARRARLLLGELYIRAGRRADAQSPLMSIIADYNQDAIRENDAEGLTLVGRAAHLLRSPRDANDAYNKAEKAGKPRVETLLYRADLYLEKYDPGHAEEVTREALKIAPHDPDAHVAMARVKLDQTLDFEAAEREIREALRINPKSRGAFFVAAGLKLRTMDLAAADATVDQGLQHNPGDLELMSLKAAVRFLADDKAGFAAQKRAVFAKNAEFSRFYQVVAEFADWEHRYDEIVVMMREATQLDPRDGKAWADLGLNSIRAGDEAGGLTALRRAWTEDRFNVRVFNTLNLYEKEIATSYETVEGTPFRIRYHKDERAILTRYVPAMLHEAWSAMVKRYGFTPRGPIFVELYADKQHFSVRTSGLPNVGIQGVCFGRTLAAMSPRAEPFNWGNVLWHELAHVFAIQLSNSRVPRWFTEGLSEYETIVRRSDWQREEDPSLYLALAGGRIPAIERFNEAFTHATDGRDVMMAYYAASQIQVYVAEAFGFARVSQMLRLWGEGKRTGEVIQSALGISPGELDQRVRSWLGMRFARYADQFVPDLRRGPLDEAKKAVEAAPTDVGKKVSLAIASLGQRDLDGADSAIAAALALNPIEPTARLMRAKIKRARGDDAGARQELIDLVRAGSDGYAPRMMLAEIAVAQKRTDAARYNWGVAAEFDPSMVEPLQALLELDEREKRLDGRTALLRKIARLDQHDRKSYRLLLEALIQEQQFVEAKAVGEAALFVDVENHAVHALYATALSKTGDHAKAAFELESALLCNPPPPEAARLHARLAGELLALGQRARAKAEQAEALKLDPNSAEAKALDLR